VALVAGQLMEYAEKRALLAAYGLTLSPATFTAYLALLTAAPAAGTDLTMAAETEFNVSTAYARQAFGTVVPTSASPSVGGNPSTITFGPFTSAPGTCTWGMLTDALTGTTANLCIAYLLANARTPLTGDSLTGAAAGFTAQI
jgi:hypothetical protein